MQLMFKLTVHPIASSPSGISGQVDRKVDRAHQHAGATGAPTKDDGLIPRHRCLTMTLP
jgi:hypothetical protein